MTLPDCVASVEVIAKTLPAALGLFDPRGDGFFVALVFFFGH